MQTNNHSYHFGAYFVHEDEEGRNRNEDSEQLEECNIYAQTKFFQNCVREVFSEMHLYFV